MEALTVGVHHQYDVGAKDLDAMVAALDLRHDELFGRRSLRHG